MGKKDFKITSGRGELTELAPHPLSCEIDELNIYARSIEKPVAVDLFSGAGGLSLGLESAGFSVLLGVDFNEFAVKTHRANFGGSSIQGDLSDPEMIDRIVYALSGVDVALIAGGPPCQPFSLAGRHKIISLVNQGIRPEHDKRRDLWQGFIEIVERISPRAVLVENVPDMAVNNDGIEFRQMVERLESAGYEVHARILSAWQFGVPQHRRRLFIVGLTPGTPFSWPPPTGARVIVEEAISDLPEIEGGDFVNPKDYQGHKTVFQEASREGITGEDASKIYDHIVRPVREDDLEAFRLMSSSNAYSDLPKRLRRYRSDIFTDKYNRLEWRGLSRTITAHIAKDGYWYIHPKQHRTLSVREAARLQTFPDRFRFAGYRSNAYRQIGEAVPPLLGKEVGLAIDTSLGSKEKSRSTTVSMRPLSETLNSWIANANENDLAAPWRLSKNFWLILLGLVAFDNISQVRRHDIWRCMKELWSNPESFLHDRGRKSRLRQLGRENKLKILERIARALDSKVNGTSSNENVNVKIKGISQNKLFLAHILNGSGSTLPELIKPARVAMRIFGDDYTESQKLDVNGRLHLSRAIGASTDVGMTYAALLEVSERYCFATGPRCKQCPVRAICLTGSIETCRS